jgi:hypothetical protein
MARIIALLTCSLLSALVSGCVGGGVSPRWGENVTLVPGWQRVETAAADALLSPGTWGPALGAAVCGIGNIDSNISTWAQEETPLFGSKRRAENASDILLDTTRLSWLVTGLVTPGGDSTSEWVWNKAKGFTVDTAAISMTNLSTSALKMRTDRLRPDAADWRSFPSGHASGATVAATMAARNLVYLPLTPAEMTSGRIVFASLAAGTGWARIEGGKHYPSDVLAGTALGHFFGAFIRDAFLTSKVQPTIELARHDLFLGFSRSY